MMGRHHIMRFVISALVIGSALCAQSAAVRAEVQEVKLGVQLGLAHLPTMIIYKQQLFEKELAKRGLTDTKVTTVRLSGSAQSEALLSGSIHFTSGGVTELATMWSATKGKVKSIGAVAAHRMHLLTNDPDIKSIKDLTSKHKIALPAIKVSPQALILQMAAQKEFGDYTKLDSLTVSLSHADATAALLSGNGAINCHFSLSPFQEIALADPKIHSIMTSHDITGGPITLNVISAMADFKSANPKTVEALIAAFEKAMDIAKTDTVTAAQIYIEFTNDKRRSVNEVKSLLERPDMVFSMTPLGTSRYTDIMHRTGAIKNKPESWKDMFFENVHSLNGS